MNNAQVFTGIGRTVSEARDALQKQMDSFFQDRVVTQLTPTSPTLLQGAEGNWVMTIICVYEERPGRRVY